ncbi:MAG: HisA/HisF-related TIM barrel protein [Candidatus Bathyarchaeota archaeon]
MEIIPVMDVLNGVVIHAIKGEREKYKPVKSMLCTSPKPGDVALTFKNLGFKSLYIADLDAIINEKLSLNMVYEIKNVWSGVNLMVDAGKFSLTHAEKLLKSGVSKVVIGTETLENLNRLTSLSSKVVAENFIISLDFKGEKILTNLESLKGFSPVKALKFFLDLGFKNFIYLDLLKVGSLEGVELDIVSNIVKCKGEASLIVGGGVKSFNEILKLRDVGVDGVLVSTAIHKGLIGRKELDFLASLKN